MARSSSTATTNGDNDNKTAKDKGREGWQKGLEPQVHLYFCVLLSVRLRVQYDIKLFVYDTWEKKSTGIVDVGKELAVK